MKPLQQLVSKLDKSVNFVFENGQEARYVRRIDEYFIVYLSSHNGCNQSCRFCHLTQTGQTNMNEASVDQMLVQAKTVLNHYLEQTTTGKEKHAERVHFNWMARGDALHSQTLVSNWDSISSSLYQMCQEFNLKEIKFNISSIFPIHRGLEWPAVWIQQFNTTHKPVFFYSLYSMDEKFRKRWIPKGMQPMDVLKGLKLWQDMTGQEVVLHWAFIKGQNDSEQTVAEVLRAVEKIELNVRFNLVRYNPFTSMQGEESDPEVIDARFQNIVQFMKIPGSRIVPRVGLDVSCSCGTFVNNAV